MASRTRPSQSDRGNGGDAIWALVLSFIGDAGDYISGGGFRRFTPQNASMHARCTANILIVDLRSGSESWSLYLAAPRGTPLRVGTYKGAARHPFTEAGQPGLSLSGAGRACNRSTGEFTVHQADFAPTTIGEVRQFRATFEQHCEGGTPATRGEVRLLNPPLYQYPSALAACLLP